MSEKELKANIKKARDFLALWVKFHSLYKDATKKEAITQEEEDVFLETKTLLGQRYKALKGSLNLGRSSDDEMKDVISHLLSLKGMAAMSDEALRKIEESWNHSYVFLNKLLKDLEGQTQVYSNKRPFIEFLKRLFSKKAAQLIVLILLIFIMFYAVNVALQILLK
jgi:hypothetical protein